jgi:hypothetical protein
MRISAFDQRHDPLEKSTGQAGPVELTNGESYNLPQWDGVSSSHEEG